MLTTLFLMAIAADAPVAEQCTTTRETVRVMVMDLTASNIDSATAKSIGQIIAKEAAGVPGHVVVTNDELRAVLDQEAQKMMMGCSESECLAEFAGALDADLLVSGQLNDSDDATTISLSLLNTRALVTVNRVNMTWAGARERLPDVARSAALLLLLDKSKRRPGAVAIEGAPEGVHVFVDDEDLTERISNSVVGGLEIGTHVVRLEADGFEPKDVPVLIMSGETARIDGALDGRPLYTSVWLWTGVGAAVVVTFAATAGLFLMNQDASVAASSTIPTIGIGNVEGIK